MQSCSLVRGVLVGLLLSLGISGFAESRNEITLTKGGKPDATIIIASNASHAARFAVQELRDHILKITGAELSVADDRQSVKGTRVLVGASEATIKLGLKNDDFKSQEYLARFLPDTLVLMGHDNPAPVPNFLQNRGEVSQIEGKFGKALSFEKGAVTVDGFEFSDDAGSLEAWIWVPAKCDRGGTLFRLDGTSPCKTYHIVGLEVKNKIKYIVYFNKNVEGKDEAASVQSAELSEGWHHILATYSVKDQKMSLFVDSKRQGEAKYLRPTNCKGVTLNIGGVLREGPDGVKIGGGSFPGIDEVRISKIVRNADTNSSAAPFATDADTLLLAHFDEAPDRLADDSGIKRPIRPPKVHSEQGTCYAVYDFLERFCGVRWYMPGDLGMVYPSQATLKIGGSEVRRSPVFIQRDTHWYPGDGMGRTTCLAWNNPAAGEMDLFWCRMRMGGERIPVNHSFYGFYDRFWKKNPSNPDVFEGEHPEYFALGQGDRRDKQMCYSNPEFIKQVARDAGDFFDGKGLKTDACAGDDDYFALVPMDHGDYCACPACREQFDPAKKEKDKKRFSTGYSSDYIFGFINKVAKEVQQTNPGKHLSALAYYNYAYYPEKVRLETNVLVSLCLADSYVWPWPDGRERDLGWYRIWIDKEKGRCPLTLWLYYHQEYIAQGGKYHCFPAFYAHIASEQFKMFAKDGILGAYLCGDGFPVFDKYWFYRLMDNPDQDVDKALDEFFTGFYGAAAEPMKKIYLTMEKIYADPANYPADPDVNPEEIAWKYQGTEERMAELGKLMQEAKVSAKSEVDKKRVELFEKSVWNYMVEGRKMYLARPKKTPEQLAGEKEKAKKRDALKTKPIPQLKIPKIIGSADGDLTRIDWSKAASSGPWFTVEGDAITKKISASILHDDQYLYVKLTDETDPAKLVAGKNVFDGDNWDLFFAAARGQFPFRQLGINPKGEYREVPHGEKEWTSGVKIVSDTSAPGVWTVCLALPLDKLLPGGVKNGQKIFANFYRQCSVPEGRQIESGSNFLAWSPNFEISFQKTDRLVELMLEEK